MYYKILLGALIIISNITSYAFAADTSTLIITEEWPPYNYTEEEKLTGFSVEIVQNMMQVMDKDYQIQLLPSMRTTRVISTRPRTIMFSLFRTPEREPNYKWIGPLINGAIFPYKKRDNKLKIESLEEMRNVRRIATRHSGLIPNILSAQGFENLDMTATSSLQVYRKLLVGRADIAISDTDLGVSYNLKLLGAEMAVLEKIPIIIFKSDLYIAASKDIADTEIQQWQSALDTLKENGIYDEIYEKYMRSNRTVQ